RQGIHRLDLGVAARGARGRRDRPLQAAVPDHPQPDQARQAVKRESRAGRQPRQEHCHGHACHDPAQRRPPASDSEGGRLCRRIVRGRGAGMRYRGFKLIAGLLLTVCASTATLAEDNFPSRSIRVVIPYGPGTVADIFGRIVAHNMAAQWNGATIVFESKSGANGSIAAEDVARSVPDGYTWLLAQTYFVASPAPSTNLRWDPQRDF